ncbi:MAG: endonuclease I family protein [Bacillota bacterium]
MKRTVRKIVALVVLLTAGAYFADDYFELGIVDQVLTMTDREAPTIKTDDLREEYRLNEDVSLDAECEDNVDDSCEVTIEGTLDTSEVGEHTVVLVAVDKAGNRATYDYTYEVTEEVDGSAYIPAGYYDDALDLEGDALKSALHDIIDDHEEYPYTSSATDVWDILREADEDPDNPDNVLTFYTGLSVPKDCQDTINPPDFCEMESYGETNTVEWNREHIWSKSRGDFSDASDLGPYTDTHHLVAEERVMNSIKNNRFYEDCNDGDDDNVEDRDYGNYTCNTWEFEPRDEVKGDTARMIFYMAVRYEDELDLEVVDDPDEDRSLKDPVYGDLDDLLRWHEEDPVSEKEVERNEVIYSYQDNRNPFIDNPDYVEAIWGTD